MKRWIQTGRAFVANSDHAPRASRGKRLDLFSRAIPRAPLVTIATLSSRRISSRRSTIDSPGLIASPPACGISIAFASTGVTWPSSRWTTACSRTEWSVVAARASRRQHGVASRTYDEHEEKAQHRLGRLRLHWPTWALARLRGKPTTTDHRASRKRPTRRLLRCYPCPT